MAHATTDRADLAGLPAWVWASGEESSDPLVHHEGTTVRVDELGGTGHLDRMEQDCADVAALGCTVWRYGMPWQRTEVEPGDDTRATVRQEGVDASGYDGEHAQHGQKVGR